MKLLWNLPALKKLKKEENLTDDMVACLYVVDKGTMANTMASGRFGILPSMFSKKEGGLIILVDDGLFFIKYVERLKTVWDDNYTFIPFRGIVNAQMGSSQVDAGVFKKEYAPSIVFQFNNSSKIKIVLFGFEDDTDNCVEQIRETIKLNVNTH